MSRGRQTTGRRGRTDIGAAEVAASEVAEGEIRRRLLSPTEQITLPELAERWFASKIELVIAGYGKLAADPGLPGRLRGALGTALAAGASAESLAGAPCPFDPPCAFEALFRKQGRMMAGLDLPSPWVIGALPRRGDLVVTLSLFGFANDWAPAAAEALTRTVTELVDWKGCTTLFLPKLAITRRSIRAAQGVRPTERDRVVLDLVSPVTLTGHSPLERPASLITGLAARISGLARWHDVAVDVCTDWKALKERARGLEYSFEDIETVRWTRGSRRQDRAIPMSGTLGCLMIAGDLGQDIAALIALGATCHMGADVALGCGRYRIVDAT